MGAPVTWDYTSLADAYLKRPDYSPAALRDLFELAASASGARILDVGAGVGHLALELAKAGYIVVAVEPNDAMRRNGINRTKSFSNVTWFDGTGENTNQGTGDFEGVTFGSSFNVTQRDLALKEAHRILRPGGWFACMWNHRDLNDPVQRAIEDIIRNAVPSYTYGTRREDQTEIIEGSGLFGPCTRISGPVQWSQSVDDCVEAWRSHATLQRQAGSAFPRVVAEIDAYLRGLCRTEVTVPYNTEIWFSRRLD